MICFQPKALSMPFLRLDDGKDMSAMLAHWELEHYRQLYRDQIDRLVDTLTVQPWLPADQGPDFCAELCAQLNASKVGLH